MSEENRFDRKMCLGDIFSQGRTGIPMLWDIFSLDILSGRTEFPRIMCPPDTISYGPIFLRHRYKITALSFDQVTVNSKDVLISLRNCYKDYNSYVATYLRT